MIQVYAIDCYFQRKKLKFNLSLRKIIFNIWFYIFAALREMKLITNIAQRKVKYELRIGTSRPSLQNLTLVGQGCFVVVFKRY